MTIQVNDDIWIINGRNFSGDFLAKVLSITNCCDYNTNDSRPNIYSCDRNKSYYENDIIDYLNRGIIIFQDDDDLSPIRTSQIVSAVNNDYGWDITLSNGKSHHIDPREFYVHI